MYNIVLITGSRAEYGIMKNLIEKLDDDENINLKIVACAMHMEEKYGYTYKEIEKDGFKIDQKIPMNIKDTNDETLLKSMSILQDKLAEYFTINNFDLAIILGDRYEMLSVVNCCTLNKIPICHLHGGEKTLGNYDEFIRHAITKMSHIHLTSTEEYRRRVIQLGEQPNKVFNIGSLGVENVLSQTFLTKSELESELSCELEKKYYVVLFHPVTLDGEGTVTVQIENLLKALIKFKDEFKFIFIGSNSDSGSDIISNKINEFCKKTESKSFKSLSTQQYHSLVKHSQGLIGNSSSGIIEVPSLKRYTINIGKRQEGRVQSNSVVNTSSDTDEIINAINRVNELNKKEIKCINPYFKENATLKAYEVIKSELSESISIKKEFYDIDFEVIS